MMVVTDSYRKWFPNFNVCLAAIISNLTASAVTCVMSWSSPALPMITRPGAKIFVTQEEGAILSSIAALGASFGPFVTGPLADRYGRKTTLLGGMLLLVGTWIVFYFCDVFVILVGTRCVAGVCAGCVYGTLPMYIAEISPVHLRGSLGSLLQFFDCIGYLIENIAGSYVSYENLSLLSGSVALFSFLLFVWIPESPYYLQNRGKEVEARRALRFFRDNADDSQLENEIEEMRLYSKNMGENHDSCVSLFKTKGNLKCVYYAAALIFFQQMSGINIITFYSKTVFLETKSNISADQSAVILAVVMMITSLVTVTASRFFNLRTMLYYSTAGVTISMGVLGGFFIYTRGSDSDVAHSLDSIPLISLVTYMITYTLGWGPLVWCITSVIFPSNLKATACGMCASFMWFLAFVLTAVFPMIDPAVGFSIFGGVMLVSFFFIRFHLPETRGKTFHEIQDMIQGGADRSLCEKKVQTYSTTL